VRTVLGFLRRRAHRERGADGRSGAVVIVQRFSGALILNVHLHALVPDGVFTNDGGAYLTDYDRSYPLVLVRLSRIERDALRDLLSVSWRLTSAKGRKVRRTS